MKRLFIVTTFLMAVSLTSLYTWNHPYLHMILHSNYIVDKTQNETFSRYEENRNNSLKKMKLIIRGKQDVKEQAQMSTQKNEIMLFGYLRGGTTFLGAMLGQRKDTFYHYEPLLTMTVFGYFTKDRLCKLQQPECSVKSPDGAISYLQKVYDCNHTNVQPATISLPTINHFGEWHKELSQIYSKKKIDASYMQQIAAKCLNSNNILTKVARLSMRLTSNLLSSRPNLRIVYLIRDPRAVLLSRIDAFQVTNITGWSRSLCQKMEEDYKEAIRLSMSFPKRILILTYEDFVTRPKTLLGPLHKFAGLSFSKEDEMRAMKLIMPTSNSTKRNKWSVVRPLGSAQTAVNWRKTISMSVMKVIDGECARTLQLLNYTLFSNEEALRDVHNSSFTGKSSLF